MVETNFKHTEIGLIPHDWEVKTLGEHASIFRGGSPRPIEAFITNSVDGINWLKIGDVAPTDKYFTKCVEKILPSGVAHSRRVFAGDFILSNSMSFGRPYILKINGCIHDGWLVIQDYSTSFNMEYLYYVLSSDSVKKQYISMAAGSSVQNLNKDKVACVQVITPPTLAEQERIAGALSSIDTLIGALNEQIEKKRHIKQGTMQQLLTGKKRLAGFTGEWKICKIKDIVGSVKRGQGLQSKDYVKGNIPVVAGGKQYAGFHNVANHFGCTITVSGSGANAGYVAFHAIPIFATDCSVIDGNDDFVLAFVYYVLLNKQSEIYKLQSGGAQPHIYPKNIEDIMVSIPPTIAEQSAIAAVLSGMDTEIAALEQKRDKYIAIKSGMMQDLLTGKIRLV